MINLKKVDPRPNIVFFTLNFFKKNYKVLSLIILLAVTIQIALTYFGSLFSRDSDLITLLSTVKNPTPQQILNSLSFPFLLGQVYSSAVSILITVVFSIVLKVIYDLVKAQHQQNLAIYEIDAKQLNIAPKRILSILSDLFFRKETFTVTFKVIWLSFVYLVAAFGICLALIYITVVLGLGYIFPLTFVILYGYIVVSLPALITGLVIFNYNGKFGEYWQDIKAIFGRYGSDVFNYLIFVAVVRVLLSTIIVFLIAIITKVIYFIGLSSLANMINTTVVLYITGFLALILEITGFFVVAFYKDAQEKLKAGQYCL